METNPPAEPSRPSAEEWAVEPATQASASARFQPWQVRLLLVPLALLALYALGMWRRNPDLFSLLWRDPMGVKMAVVAVGTLLGGAFFFSGGCVLLNRLARVPWNG